MKSQNLFQISKCMSTLLIAASCSLNLVVYYAASRVFRRTLLARVKTACR